MIYPRVKFNIDHKLDIDVIANFIDKKIGDFDFGQDRIISEHPKLEKAKLLSSNKKLSFVEEYVKEYYHKHANEIETATEKMQALWQEIEELYYTEIYRLFGGLDFYKPDLISAYVSITKCGVIGDDQKSFQIWYNTMGEPTEVKRHVAHEVLHFYYYAYLDKKGMKKILQDWDTAEIFNVVILNLPQFIKLTGKKEEGYKIHQNKLRFYKDLWVKSGELDKYLSSIQGSPPSPQLPS